MFFNSHKLLFNIVLICLTVGLICWLYPARSVTAAGNSLEEAKNTAIKYAEEQSNLTVDIAKSLWEYAEIGLNEYKSYVKVRDALASAGFNITDSAADIPTCLIAQYGTGKPVIGIYEDIDALPDVGHGCGHNLNTAAGIVAAMSIKKAMETHHIPGTIKIFINPAEEIWDVAPLVAAAGYYDDVDALISFHAATENTSEYGSTMAMDHVEYKFKGVASHSSAAPEKGRSALDAVEIMNVAVNYLREHLIQEMRIHYVITDGGAAPNIVPASAASRYFIRGPQYPDVAYARQRIDDCAKAAALATGTEMEIGFSSGIYNKIPNKALALLTVNTILKTGLPQFTEQEINTMASLGITGVPNNEIKEPEGSQSFGSNPIGDVTWKTPTTTLNIATWVPDTPGHSEKAAIQNNSIYGFKGAVAASKALASLGLELMMNPDSLAEVTAEHKERMKDMPKYEGKAMIPESAYPEAPGIVITAINGLVTLIPSETAFDEKEGDTISVKSVSNDVLGEYTIAKGVLSKKSADGKEYSFELKDKVEPGQRLKVFYTAAEGNYIWFYGYVHAK
ncbi:amidohydrolase [Acetomicrobium sp.]|jgi:aminobenzoyl-glutamate utilization protein B|uniref:amidohydrolase n=1 Tax=Acetomicrobium sp. TaxID=1872099 RepID=UPI002871C7D2|nr:amidohydrolase [Acetomicrobium sp.]MDR9769309.1 amidohydrolase [Acetomicrobium sp.]